MPRENLFLKSALFEAGATVARAAKISLVIDPSALDDLQKKTDACAMAEVIYGGAKAPDAPERAAGELVGELLLMAISNELQTPGSVSLNGILDYASRYFTGAQKATPEALKKIWHEHRPVAHLWAALLRWNAEKQTEDGRALVGDDARLIPADPERLCDFLAFSEILRIKGEAIKHKHAKDAFLPAGVAWRLPGNLPALRAAVERGSKIL
jgi:hypothetical protein